MTDKKLKLVKFLVCEDVRKEESKQFVFLGVFPDDIFIVHSKSSIDISLFLMFNIENIENNELNFNIIDPKKNIVFAPENFYKPKNLKFSLNAVLKNFIPPEYGEYRIIIFINGKEEMSIPFWIKKGGKQTAVTEDC
jgi:hypothetical protein